MEKHWTTFSFLATSNTVILAGEMDFLQMFDREDDHSSSKFTMKWSKWSDSCKLEEEAPNERQKIILTNPIKAWVVQCRKCNVKNHFKKTEPRQLVITPALSTSQSRESNK
ncbi:hypothetical protein IEE_00613 [Bacillus cereus BAG5X1-1]|uniref:Uncharacterized protein n=1 Tax=Bacillus cereus BAG5X1-1 TaxID=1053189 RepID=J8BEW1_BACCE|nr:MULTISPECIES: hypothetical protein [Bacillus cereus group]EJQ50215.1 hypothetical protein IEE_00613 [Bacillus cereus BAG5X1-1]MDM5464723.1 hypothetical protein [Bacillus cereus]PGY09363.1 hypothetical protein COE23_24235 [Bacillus cereus]QWH39656.1 hypothetical protein EXW53_23340 [Bacillus mycoides]QWI51740.1 hypothetical protein EXW56_23515 [Bacillus mycoides]